jgi:hypothetical protein
VPDELAGYEDVTPFDLFMQADTCANEIFSFGDRTAGTIDTDISRLFIDLDRPYTALSANGDGVVKKTTLDGKPLFRDNHFPDEIAIANMLHRYYRPFHNTIKKILDAGGVKLILECHTMMAVGPRLSRDPGRPRPIVLMETAAASPAGSVETCRSDAVAQLKELLSKSLAREEGTVQEKVVINNGPCPAYILGRYGTGAIPMIRISLSRALFLNDRYFSYEYLRVDELRICYLRDLLWEALDKWYVHNF